MVCSGKNGCGVNMFEFYVSSVVLVMVGIFCTVFKSNLMKKIIGLGITSNGIHLLLISIGYRSPSVAPILTRENILTFSKLSVDPLPQALVLTSIVIDLSITTLALIMVIWIYKRFRTIDSDKLTYLRG